MSSCDNIKFKPLTMDEVLEINKKFLKMDSATINKILTTYSNIVYSLLKLAIKNCEDEADIVELERLKRVIKLCDDAEIFIRTKDKVWAVREKILNKDADYFLNKDYSSGIKQDEKQSMIETIIMVVKEKYNVLTQNERNMYWKKAFEMLNLVIQYKELSGEYTEG